MPSKKKAAEAAAPKEEDVPMAEAPEVDLQLEEADPQILANDEQRIRVVSAVMAAAFLQDLG
jgi:hypothetical protein